MRLYRCYTPQPLANGQQVELDQRSQHHLINVLRARRGDALILFNGDGQDYHGELIAASKREAQVHILDSRANLTEANRKITLQQAIAKGERMDWIIQKATELGVHSIQPLNTERTNVNLSGDRLRKRLAHWQGVVISACEQCGRACVPEVLAPVRLDRLALNADQTGIVLHPNSDLPLRQVAADTTQLSMTMAIGPEGGFSDVEIDQLLTLGYQRASLGTRVLRTETAAMAALAVLNLA